MQFICAPAFFVEHGSRSYPKQNGITITATLLKPKSVGSVSLRSKNPLDAPSIQANALLEKEDVQVLVEGVKFGKFKTFIILHINTCTARKAFAEAPLNAHMNYEVVPGEFVQGDAAIEQYVRNVCQTLYHPVGSCKMGNANDSMSVVSHTSLKVHGVEGIRVIDASVMPSIVRGNTNAPVAMIAEKGSDLILQDYK